MAKKSYNDYIKNQDLEGIYERFMNAPANWKNHWWEGVVSIFRSCADFAKRFTLDLANRILRPLKAIAEKVTVVKSRIAARSIPIVEAADFSDCHGEQVYFFKFFNDKGEILWTKIGTTTKSYLDRLKQEIYYYNKRGHGVAKVLVESVLNCGDIPAESYESYLRAILIKEFPNTWKKNDRFFGTNIPVDRFTAICNDFAKL